MLLLLIACAAPPAFEGLAVQPTERVNTVLEVTWVRGEATEAWVELDDGAVFYDVGDGPEVRVLIAGYPELTALGFTPVVELDGERVEGPPSVGETGLLPAGLPLFRATDSGLSDSDFPYLLTTYMSDESGILVLNRDGEIVWHHAFDDGARAPDIHWDAASAQLSTLYGAREFTAEMAGIQTFGMDGELLFDQDTPLGHHSLARPDEETWAYLKMDVRDPDGQGDVIGDAIVELGGDGQARTLWSSWDTLTFDGRGQDSGAYSLGYDWSHGNALRWVPERQSYLYSARWLDSVVEVSRDGAVLNIFGGLQSQGVSPEAEAFVSQHGPSITPEGTLLVFDNRHPEAVSERTRVAEYRIEGGALEHLTDFKAQPGYHVLALGDATRLADGHTLTSWGSVGQLVEFDDQGEEVWRAAANIGFMLGNVTALRSLGAEAR